MKQNLKKNKSETTFRVDSSHLKIFSEMLICPSNLDNFVKFIIECYFHKNVFLYYSFT